MLIDVVSVFRLETASKKIEGLKDSKKAIRIYSPAKYPVQLPKFTPTFPKNQRYEGEIDFNYRIKNNPAEDYATKKYSDKLQFYHLKRAPRPTTPKPNLVFTTKSINSLITFINNENILLSESTAKIRVKDSVLAQSATNRNDETDFSRFSTLIRSKHDSENFHYFPGMNQAPEIELPEDLPDLPGIADDISFTLSSQDLIVPSLAKMNIINELPNVTDLIEAESNKKLQEMKNQEPSAQSVSVSAAPNVPIVPPPPVIAAPPPPPPPIPISMAIPAPPPVPPPGQPTPAPAMPAASDARSNLMQAIRNAGGKNKLRSVAAADEEVANAPKPKAKAAPPAGDFMADLHAKIALRRQGIAGSKEAKKEKGSMMDKVSKLIPPPPPDSDSDSTNGDEDWD